MHVDVPEGTQVGAFLAADAPAFDLDFEGILPPDAADRALGHAKRIVAGAAGRGDEEAVVAQAVAQQPGDAVVRLGAGVDAGVAARAFVQINEQKVLRFKESLVEELVHVQTARALLGGVRAQAGVRDHFQLHPHGRIALQDAVKKVALDAHQVGLVKRTAGRHALAVGLDEADLAEVIAPAHVGAHDLAARQRLADFHHAAADEVKRVRRLAFIDDRLAGRIGHELDLALQLFEKRVVEQAKHGHAPQMVAQAPLAVAVVHHFAERLAARVSRGFHQGETLLVLDGDLAGAAQNVEHHAQHLDHHAVLRAGDRGRPRLEIPAGHLAENIARPQLGDGPVAGQVNVRVDRDEILRLRIARRVLVRHQKAGHALHLRDAAPHEAAAAGAPGVDQGDRVENGDLDLAADDVKSRRAEVALLADHVAGAETAQRGGALRHALELRPLEVAAGEDFRQKRHVRDQFVRRQCLTAELAQFDVHKRDRKTGFSSGRRIFAGRGKNS